MQGILAQGIETISESQVLTFVRYDMMILPTDGYVFWVASATSVSAPGSFHIATARNSREDETVSTNSVVFTTQTDIVELNVQAPGSIWIATVNGTQFAFSQRGMFYQQTATYHYRGAAVWASLASLLVPDPSYLVGLEPIVSNSLPAWLTLKTYNPAYLRTRNPGITIYPAFLSPSNIAAPASSQFPAVGTVSIRKTETYQPVPYWSVQSNKSGAVSGQYQLAKDTVKIVFYNCNNNQAEDFLALVLQYAEFAEGFGIVTAGAIQDEQRAQDELMAISMKKSIEFEVSYLQTRMDTIARQLITSVVNSYALAHY